MADNTIPHFHNEVGVPQIRIGVREFMCIGALPPLDHPHIFLDLGEGRDIVCPYCSTRYIYDAALGPHADPVTCEWHATP